MDSFSYNNDKATAQLERIKNKDQALVDEYEQKKEDLMAKYSKPESGLEALIPVDLTKEAVPGEMHPRVEEAIAMAHFRPVLVIRDNKIVPEFVGPDVSVWKDRLMER